MAAPTASSRSRIWSSRSSATSRTSTTRLEDAHIYQDAKHGLVALGADAGAGARGASRRQAADARRGRGRSTRSAAWCSRWSAGCRRAARSSGIRAASSSRCWMPIRAASRRLKIIDTRGAAAGNQRPRAAGQPAESMSAASRRQRAVLAPTVASGWREWCRLCGSACAALAAFVAGAVSVLAMAPFFVWPVLFVTLPVLVWLIDRVQRRRRGRRWLALLLAGLVVRLRLFPARAVLDRRGFPGRGRDVRCGLLPFAVTLLPAGLALFFGVGHRLLPACCRGPGATGCWRWRWRCRPREWLRGHVLTGFPVEHARLCADHAAAADAVGGAGRDLRFDAAPQCSSSRRPACCWRRSAAQRLRVGAGRSRLLPTTRR